MQTPHETLDAVGTLVRRLGGARGEDLSRAIATAWALLERHRAVLDYEWVLTDPARLAVLPEIHGRPTIEEFAAHRLDDIESDFREIHGDLVPSQLLERQLTSDEASALHGALLALLSRPPDVAR